MRAEDKYETERNAARVQQEVKKTDRCETSVSLRDVCRVLTMCLF